MTVVGSYYYARKTIIGGYLNICSYLIYRKGLVFSSTVKWKHELATQGSFGSNSAS
jgi:hypothetical protein